MIAARVITPAFYTCSTGDRTGHTPARKPRRTSSPRTPCTYTCTSAGGGEPGPHALHVNSAPAPANRASSRELPSEARRARVDVYTNVPLWEHLITSQSESLTSLSSPTFITHAVHCLVLRRVRADHDANAGVHPLRRHHAGANRRARATRFPHTRCAHIFPVATGSWYVLTGPVAASRC